MAKFPQELDGDAELYAVQNDTDSVLAEHHNALKEAIKALEEKVGVDLSAVTTSLDYIVKQLTVKSEPPSGMYKVTNIYVTQHPSGKLKVEYDDTPVP